MEFDPNSFVTLGIVLLGFVAIRFMPRILAGVPFVDPRDVKNAMDSGIDFLVIDVRADDEFNGKLGHVPGALNLPLYDVRSRISETSGDLEPFKQTRIFLICRTSNRSASAVKLFKKAGFTNLCVVNGGMLKWKQRELAVEGKS